MNLNPEEDGCRTRIRSFWKTLVIRVQNSSIDYSPATFMATFMASRFRSRLDLV